MFHEIKNLKKAAKRIKQAVKNSERIVIFADADLDGTTSAIILEETISNLSGKVDLVFFPDRGECGYGLSEKAVDSFSNIAPGLLIILDCGIGSFEGIKKASELGFDVIVIDHHEILGELPKPALIVDPKQSKDKYPFKKLANVSLTYKLSEEIFGKKMPNIVQKGFFELAALGAIADMMPEEDYNKKVIEEGQKCLKETFRPGFIALIDYFKEQKEGEESQRAIFSKIVTILNITNLKNNLTESYLFFKENNLSKAREMIRMLSEEATKRQMRIQEITEQIVANDNSSESIVFQGNEMWEQVLTGPVASRVCNKTKKPTFVYKVGKEKCRGSVRMPDKRDGVMAMKACESFLEVYGGHPPAAGFTCDKSQVEGLKKCLEEYFETI
ncbi:MAG: DHH family phosphoesterase [Candidatus Pacebacteria bacterium]|nr:DHH family phosphoesterase [Candidatus Paceibacterota bacterium]